MTPPDVLHAGRGAAAASSAGTAGGGVVVLALLLVVALTALMHEPAPDAPAERAKPSQTSVRFEHAATPFPVPFLDIQPVSLLEPLYRPLPEAELTWLVNQAHAEIGEVYQAVMTTLTPAQQKVLRLEQRAWIKLRDAEADRMAFNSAADASTRHPARQEALIALVQQRTSYLREYRPMASAPAPARLQQRQ